MSTKNCDGTLPDGSTCNATITDSIKKCLKCGKTYVRSSKSCKHDWSWPEINRIKNAPEPPRHALLLTRVTSEGTDQMVNRSNLWLLLTHEDFLTFASLDHSTWWMRHRVNWLNYTKTKCCKVIDQLRLLVSQLFRVRELPSFNQPA